MNVSRSMAYRSRMDFMNDNDSKQNEIVFYAYCKNCQRQIVQPKSVPHFFNPLWVHVFGGSRWCHNLPMTAEPQ